MRRSDRAVDVAVAERGVEGDLVAQRLARLAHAHVGVELAVPAHDRQRLQQRVAPGLRARQAEQPHDRRVAVAEVEVDDAPAVVADRPQQARRRRGSRRTARESAARPARRAARRAAGRRPRARVVTGQHKRAQHRGVKRTGACLWHEIVGPLGEQLVAVVGDDHQVLDAHPAVLGVDRARLDGDDVAGDERRAAGAAERGRLVDLEPDAVAEPEEEPVLERLAGLLRALGRDARRPRTRRTPRRRCRRRARRAAWPRARARGPRARARCRPATASVMSPRTHVRVMSAQQPEASSCGHRSRQIGACAGSGPLPAS